MALQSVPRVGLDPGEEVVWHGQLSVRGYIIAYVGVVLFFLLVAVLPWAFLLAPLIILKIELGRRRVNYFVTSQRVIEESGLFFNTTREASLDRVTNIVTGRSIVGVGSIEITTNLRAMVTRYGSRGRPYTGYGVITFHFHGLRDPDPVRDVVMERKQLYKKPSRMD